MSTQQSTALTFTKLKTELQSKESIDQLQAMDHFRLDMARQVVFALQLVEKNPQLQQCTPESIKDCVVNIALTGLSLNPVLQQAHLIPRKVKETMVAVLDPDYKGLITKMIDFGVAKDVFANVVYENEDYEYETFTNRVIKHKTWKQKGLTIDQRGKEIGVYACILRPDGTYMYREMPMERVQSIMERSESYKAAQRSKRGQDKTKHWNSIWEGDDREEMIKKTAIKYIWKFIPKNEKMENIGRVVELSNFAHEVTDTTITGDGKDIVAQPSSTAAAAAAADRAKAPQSKADKYKEATTIQPEASAADLVQAIVDNYQLQEGQKRSHPQIMEIKELMQEHGISPEGINDMLSKRTAGIRDIDTLLYTRSADEICLTIGHYLKHQ